MSASTLVRVTILVSLVGLLFAFFRWLRPLFMGAPEPSETEIPPTRSPAAASGEVAGE
jgi:hypothetical protein